MDRAAGGARAQSHASVGPYAQAHTSGTDTNDDADDTGRESGERQVGLESHRPTSGASENTNHRADLIQVNIPPPPRLPSFSRAEREADSDPPLVHSASLLDAPHSLRPDSAPAAARPSFALFGLVAIFSAIIVSAGIVALRESTKGDVPRVATAALSSPSQGQPPAEQPRQARLDNPPLGLAATDSAAAAVDRPSPAANEAAESSPERGHAAASRRAPAARVRAQARTVSTRAPVSAELPSTPDAPAETREEAVAGEGSEAHLPDPDEPLELPVNPYR